jgi:hypothetical protein
MNEEPPQFADDPTHPIPCVYAYDADLTFAGGGAYLGIVIAAPLDASTRSKARLQEKLRFYLDSFYSEFGHKTWGTPVTGKMKIYVRVHPNSSDETFQVIDAFRTEAAKPRGVDLIIDKIP